MLISVQIITEVQNLYVEQKDDNIDITCCECYQENQNIL